MSESIKCVCGEAYFDAKCFVAHYQKCQQAVRLQSEVERLRGRCGELMDFCADKIGRLPLPDDRTDFANGRYTAFHEVYVEAQRLRQQADELEHPDGRP